MSILLTANIRQDTVVLGRMYGILSEGRKIESRRQPNPAIALKIETRGRIWKR